MSLKGTKPPAQTSLLRSGLHALGAGVLSVPLGILSSIVVSRILGPEGRGAYNLVITTSLLLWMVLGISLPSGVTYVVAKGGINTRALTARLLPIAVAQGGIAAVILYGLSLTGFGGYLLPTEIAGWIVLAVGFHVISTAVSTYWRGVLVGREEIVRASRRDVAARSAEALFPALVALLLVLTSREVTPELVIVANIAATAFGAAIFVFAVGRAPVSAGAPSGLGEVVRYSVPSFGANLAQFFNYRLSIFVVGGFAGLSAVGFYTLALTLAQMLWLMSNAAALVILPRIAATQEDVAGNASRTAQVARMTFWLSVFGALVIGVGGMWAIPVVYGEEFRESIVPLLILLPGVVAFSLVNVLASYLAGVGKPKLNMMISVASLCVTVTAGFTLIPLMGAVGAALVSTLSYLTGTVLTVRVFAKLSRTAVRDVVLPTAEDLALSRALARSILNRLRFGLNAERA